MKRASKEHLKAIGARKNAVEKTVGFATNLDSAAAMRNALNHLKLYRKSLEAKIRDAERRRNARMKAEAKKELQLVVDEARYLHQRIQGKIR